MSRDLASERQRTRKYHAKAKALGVRRLQNFVLESDLEEIHQLLKPYTTAARKVMAHAGQQLDLLEPPTTNRRKA